MTPTTPITNSTNRLAVITGASSGIGYELARVFAENGFDLLINAEGEAIETARLTLSNGTNVDAVRADLSRAEGVETLYAAVRDAHRPVDALVLNAGIGEGGDFARETSLQQELQLIDLNVRSVVHLSKLVVDDMVQRGEGRVLFTSSIASTMPGTYQAVYNASKSFVQSFALALRNELKDTNVTVTSLMPGPTDTEFFERADMLDTKIAADDKDDPADVAADGFAALMEGDERVVSASLKTRLQGRGSRMLPDSAKAELHRKMAEPGSAER